MIKDQSISLFKWNEHSHYFSLGDVSILLGCSLDLRTFKKRFLVITLFTGVPMISRCAFADVAHSNRDGGTSSTVFARSGVFADICREWSKRRIYTRYMKDSLAYRSPVLWNTISFYMSLESHIETRMSCIPLIENKNSFQRCFNLSCPVSKWWLYLYLIVLHIWC